MENMVKEAHEENIQEQSVADNEIQLLQAFMTKSQKEAMKTKGKNVKTIEEEPATADKSADLSQDGEKKVDRKEENTKESSEESGKKDFESLYNQILKESSNKEKRAEDNMRTARQLGRNISAIKAHLSDLAKDAVIDKETLESFNELLSKDVDLSKVLTPETPQKDVPVHIAGIQDLSFKAKEVFEKYLDLSPHAESERHNADGFDTSFHLMTDEEKKKLYDTLKSHEDSPRDLLKAMLDVGVSFWEGSIGKGIKEHGSLLGIIDSQASKISKMEKVIEEYEKKQKIEKENEESFASTLPANIRGRAGKLSPGEMLKRELSGLN